VLRSTQAGRATQHDAQQPRRPRPRRSSWSSLGLLIVTLSSRVFAGRPAMRTAGESAGVDGGISLERVGPPVLTTSHIARIDTHSTLR
jgi:hypothetical protein